MVGGTEGDVVSGGVRMARSDMLAGAGGEDGGGLGAKKGAILVAMLATVATGDRESP